MAVELCKVSLWLEANLPGHPLGFLDHHIVVGNSLLGTTPELLDAGVPDAAFKPLTGDDKEWVKTLRKTNKAERKERERAQTVMDLGWTPVGAVTALARDVAVIDAGPEDSVDDVNVKADLFAHMQESSEYVHLKLAADAWCAAFVASKTPDAPPITDATVRAINEGRSIDSRVRAAVHELAEQYKFLHLDLAFPTVFARSGGFDAILGNPPWDQIQYDPRETFAASHPDIAEAPTMARRNAMLRALSTSEPETYQRYQADVRHLDGVKHFLHASGRYPLGSVGRLNTAPLFVELMWSGIAPRGRTGVIAPTGIATDSFTQAFFRAMVEREALVSLFDFENRRGIFPAVDSRTKFCVLTLLGSAGRVRESRFSFFAHEYSDLNEPERIFNLAAEDFALLNPNTKTCPIFRTSRDAEITKAIYRRVPPFVRDNHPDGNPWDVSFQLMFMMNTGSELFRQQEDLEAEGYVRRGNHYLHSVPEVEPTFGAGSDGSVNSRYLPLYEGKMATFYDHRAADVVESPTASKRQRQPRYLSSDEKADPSRLAIPLDWVNAREVEALVDGVDNWLLGVNDVTSATNERTTVCTALPISAAADSEPLLRTAIHPHLLMTILNSFPLDYAARQKVGGMHMRFAYLKQLPVLTPGTTQLYFCLITPSIVELVYTAWDMLPFAKQLGYSGPPFQWNEDRRSLLRSELDALMFHSYGINRSDTDYIIETFTTLKRKDEKNYGEFRTKRLIFDRYDAMTQAYEVAHGTVETPNGQNPPVDQQTLASYSTRLAEALQANYRTNIDPPPAHPSCAHLESTRPSWAI